MTAPPDPDAEARGSGRHSIGLLLAAAAALVLRLLFSRVNPVNYDGYWHVFIARNLPREFGALAHPPLFPLLLRGADAVRHSRFSYLSISLLAGTVAVFLFGRVLRKLCRDRVTPVLGTFALAFSPSAIALSGVAESYMLCIAFLLAALLPYVELVAPTPPAPMASRRLAFSCFAALALLSHYAAGLFLAAAVAAPFALAILEPDYRRGWRRELPGRLAADVATLLLPGAVAAALYVSLARPWVRSLSHVAAFYFDPAQETAPAFVTRTLAASFNLFSPIRVTSPAAAAAALLAFVVAALAIAVAADRRREPVTPSATPAVLLTLLIVLEMAAALRGWYPFGGAMRHQSLLLILALLAAFVAFDRILPGLSRPALRRALVAAGVAAIAANAWAHGERRWKPRPEPFSAERQRFDRDFPEPAEVHVDQFNLVGFFAQHHDWKWEFLGHVEGHPGRERYRLSRDGHSLELVAHRDVWNMDLLGAETYAALEAPPSPAAAPTFTLYYVRQALPGDAPPAPETLRQQVPGLARQAGLEVEKLDVAGADVFGQFRRGAAPAPGP